MKENGMILDEYGQELEKAVTSTQMQSEGGYLNADQGDEIISQIFKSTDLMQAIRKEKMMAPTKEITKMFVGSRIMRTFQSENEDQSAYSKGVTYNKLTLEAKKHGLPWSISEDALEDNIEGSGHENKIISHMITQMSLDLEDLALNGAVLTPTPTTLSADINDTVTTIPVVTTATFPLDSDAGYLLIGTELIGYGSKDATNFLNGIRGDGPTGSPTTPAAHLTGAAVSWSPHPLIGQQDGFRQLAKTQGGNLEDMSGVNSGNLSKEIFFTMQRAMPQQYIKGNAKSRLRWVMSYTQYINWQEWSASQTADTGYEILNGREYWPVGIPGICPSNMTDTEIMLSWMENFIFGIWRKIKVRKATEDKESINTDLRFYMSTVRSDQIIERPDAVVLSYGLSGLPNS